LSEVLNYAELSTCRKKYLLKYFGDDLEGDNCGSCDICTTEYEVFDATIIAKKILSAVVRVQNSFGKNYIIDVLAGSRNQKVLRNNHDQLSVFGIVKDFSSHELGQIINQLVNLGYLLKTEGQYPTLSISKKGAKFLSSDEKLEIKKPQADLVKKDKTKKGGYDFNNDLFEKLRGLRKLKADESNVPPFIIFGDKTLQEMAYYFPSNNEELLEISGVGLKKSEQFGEDFLRVINGFRKEKGIEDSEIPKKRTENSAVDIKMAKPKFYLKTKELLAKKIPIERIAKNQGFSAGTIVNHIEKMADAGEKMDLDYLRLPRDRYAAIEKAFLACGDEKLKPVFEYLEGKYSYDELKLVRVLLRS